MTHNGAVTLETAFSLNNTPIERWDVYTADKILTGRSRARNEVFGENEYHLGAAA